MKKTAWTTANTLWLAAYVMLTGWTFGIEVYTAGALGIVLIFFFLFLKTAESLESMWLPWFIPYVFSSVIYVWFFVRTDFVQFVFKKFWLSLSVWLVPPVSANVEIFFAMLSFFPIAFALSMNSKRMKNTTVFMMIVSVIMGIIAQYFNPPAAAGFVLLFVFSAVMRSSYFQTQVSKSAKRLFALAAILSLAAVLATVGVRPVSVAGNFFSRKESAAATSVTPEKYAATVGTPEAGSSARSSAKRIVLEEPRWATETIVEIVGISLLVVVGFAFALMLILRRRQKGKPKNFKRILLIIWTLTTLYFVIVFSAILFYSIFPPPRNNPAGNSAGSSVASAGAPGMISASSAPPAQNEGMVELSNPFAMIALLLAVIATIFYFIIKNKGLLMAPIIGTAGEEVQAIDNVDERHPEFSGRPREIVLFYYRRLRAGIGDPSQTPYEFLKVLEKLTDKSTAERLTEIFVKLRYAHSAINAEDAEFVKTTVVNLLS